VGKVPAALRSWLRHVPVCCLEIGPSLLCPDVPGCRISLCRICAGAHNMLAQHVWDRAARGAAGVFRAQNVQTHVCTCAYLRNYLACSCVLYEAWLYIPCLQSWKSMPSVGASPAVGLCICGVHKLCPGKAAAVSAAACLALLLS
jgi:hypothetical protein